MKFDYELINEYCEKLEKALADVIQLYDTCDAQINRIKSADLWYGPAANSFITRAEKIMVTCRKTEEELNNIIKYIQICSRNYESTEKSIIEKIQSVMKG